ncbi:NHL repeat-containing protein [Roseateles oligotrophus]|uniref:Gluconolaconase n=1 Tax=Roseateles oligotrophus TaxID=1769250 RepID=A0ABT2YMK2_9BURK|nr:NHL repeat-containing protein [Roseateles oligotrophus]MCV2371279.1 gluconolaconase [Roseateles oligotrophus]
MSREFSLGLGLIAVCMLLLASARLLPQRSPGFAAVEQPASAASSTVAARALPPMAKPAATLFGGAARISLLAGDGHAGVQDGPAAQARFADPYGLALSPSGTLYVADGGASNRIRSISPAGIVATLAGGEEGFKDGLGAAAALNTPSGLALDAAGNLYVADTGNHAIRKISPRGQVTTLAGTGRPGHRDGAASQALFNGPLGVAVDAKGLVYVADTYNDRIRVIRPDGQVSTLAGAKFPGDKDGQGSAARFDNPTALALDAAGMLWVADTRNDALKRVTPDGSVSTLVRGNQENEKELLRRPLSIAVTHDGVIYLGVMRHGAVLQVSASGEVHRLSGGPSAQFARPSGLALSSQGVLHLSDAAGYRLHQLQTVAAGEGDAVSSADIGPAADLALPDTGGRWPLKPQMQAHEVVGTPGEVRGRHGGDSRDHLHEGLDVGGAAGALVLAMADAKVSSPLATWAMGQTSEGLSLDTLAYIHMRVGRSASGRLLDTERFLALNDEFGRLERIRVRRGTRFVAGDVLGTINPMAHVHVELGLNGYKRNPLQLGFVDFADHAEPHIDAVEFFGADGRKRWQEKRAGRLLLPRHESGLQLVVDAWDQVDDNQTHRRLGLQSLGYQLLRNDGSPAPGFEQVRMNLDFKRLPLDDTAVKTIYASRSGVTVHGSAVTRFRYVLNNQVRDGDSNSGIFRTSHLPPGDYVLRISAQDFAGNQARLGRDVLLRLN